MIPLRQGENHEESLNHFAGCWSGRLVLVKAAAAALKVVKDSDSWAAETKRMRSKRRK